MLNTNKNNINLKKLVKGIYNFMCGFPFLLKSREMRISSLYIIYTAIVIISLPVSCKKEYERPDHFSVDLFENERNEQQKKMLSPEEATEKSLIVIKSNSTELVSKSKINNKVLFIYHIKSGETIKSSNDTIQFPIRLISDYDLKISKSNSDSASIYLIRPQSYKLLVNELQVQYQALPSAPLSN
ncbi:hypothetical protein AXA65_02470 [Chryseobacterium sp. FP211-J200]|nr:hypothetical protein AXA65_02470 [Chryseobacterium sp. FP211-J200]